MGNKYEQGKRWEELKGSLADARNNIQQEISQTGQDWNTCFRTWTFKIIPLSLHTMKLTGEISEEKYNYLINKNNLLDEENLDIKKQHPGKFYSENNPPPEIREMLLKKLESFLDDE